MSQESSSSIGCQVFFVAYRRYLGSLLLFLTIVAPITASARTYSRTNWFVLVGSGHFHHRNRIAQRSPEVDSDLRVGEIELDSGAVERLLGLQVTGHEKGKPLVKISSSVMSLTSGVTSFMKIKPRTMQQATNYFPNCASSAKARHSG